MSNADIPFFVFNKIQRHACRGNYFILFWINPIVRIISIYGRGIIVRPFYAVYRDGNAVFVKHVSCTCCALDTDLSLISISPFNKRCARIIIPAACRGLPLPVATGTKQRRDVSLYVKRRSYNAFSETYNVFDIWSRGNLADRYARVCLFRARRVCRACKHNAKHKRKAHCKT